MSSVINTGSFHSDLLPGLVKKWFEVKPADYEPIYSKMMKVESSNDAYEIHGTVTGFGALRAFNQGSSLTLDNSQEAQRPRYEHITYGLGFAITKQQMRDGKAFGDAKKFTEMLARSARITKEVVSANIINFAATSGKTMPGGDGVVLASASHPTASGLQSNILSGGTDLSESAVEAIRTQIQNATDNRGLKIMLTVGDLIVNPALEPLAHKIVNSDKQAFSPDNTANFIKDKGVIKNVIVNPYLTSTTQWQVTTSSPDGLCFILRQDAEMDTDNDFMTKNGLYSVDLRCSAGWDSFRGLYVSL